VIRSVWFGAATVLDVLLLIAGLYTAESAFEIVIRTHWAPAPVLVAALFTALPVFCLVAPFAARRAVRRGRSRAQVVGMFIAPWIYAVFLAVFLFNS